MPPLILFLAFFLESRTKMMDDWRHTLLPAIIPAALFAILIVKQPVLGTALVCVAITAAIFFVAGMRLRYFAYAFAAMLPVFYILLFKVGWRYDRILSFLHPWPD